MSTLSYSAHQQGIKGVSKGGGCLSLLNCLILSCPFQANRFFTVYAKIYVHK